VAEENVPAVVLANAQGCCVTEHLRIRGPRFAGRQGELRSARTPRDGAPNILARPEIKLILDHLALLVSNVMTVTSSTEKSRA
jgi:hypothetical protein